MGARCYNVRYVNRILNIYFRVRGRCARCARLCAQGVLAMSARLGTLFARKKRSDFCEYSHFICEILPELSLTLTLIFETIALLIRWADQFNGGHHMSKYTPTMIEALRSAQPLNLEKAQSFSAEWGVSYRSIIAKVLSLGLTYEKKAVTSSSSDRPTKADLVREIEQSLQGESLDGLQGASMRSLQALLMSIG